MHASGPVNRAALAARLASLPRRSLPVGRLTPAAVAVTVVARPGQEVVLLTVRADHLPAHRGQFALPGGRCDPDEDTPTTARRELAEELGLELGVESVIGVLDDFGTRSGYRITPVVLWAGDAPALAPDPAEVAAVHEVAFADLLRPDSPRLVPTEDPERPLIEYPLLGTTIYAHPAANLYEFRDVALSGRTTGVVHVVQPHFAWS